MSESPFWSAVRGPGGELIPAEEIDAAEEAEIATPEAPSFAAAEPALIAAPEHQVEMGGGRRRKLLLYAGVPALLLVGFLMLHSGSSSKPSTATVAQTTKTTYSAKPYTPPPIKQTQQHAKTPQQLLLYAAQTAQTHFAGQTPSEAALVLFLHRALGIQVVGSKASKPPAGGIKITSLFAGHFLLNYGMKPGEQGFIAPHSLDLSQQSSTP